jgi:LPS-assembly lipoprotein
MWWSSPVIPANAGIQPRPDVGPGVRRDGELARGVALAALACAALSLAACGFKLRGQQDFPFETINVPLATQLGLELQRSIAAASERTKVVPTPVDADAVLTVLTEQQEKVILSLNTQGRVREFQLRYRVVYRVSTPKGFDFVPPTSVVLTRDITFNDQVLAKETEEGQLYTEMRSDMVQQIIRRLARAKAVPAEDE